MEWRKTYISFTGEFLEPLYPYEKKGLVMETYTQEEEWGNQIMEVEIETGFFTGLKYDQIGQKDSLTIFLAKVEGNIGHLVADCPAGGWVEETFVFLDTNGMPIYASDFNPNPIPRVLNYE